MKKKLFLLIAILVGLRWAAAWPGLATGTRSASPSRPTSGAADQYSTVVAGRLGGSWVIDDNTTQRLGGLTEIVTLTFSADTKSAIPEKWRAIFEGAKIRQTGSLKVVRKRDLVVRSLPLEHSYVLIQQGDLARLYVLGVPAKKGVDLPTGNASIIFVPATDRRNDLLFVGGDLLSTGPLRQEGPFAVYERVRK